MKVVEIIPSLERKGGAETIFVNLSAFLSKKCEVEIVILYKEKVNKQYKSIIETNNIKITFLGKRKGPDLNCARQLKEYLIVKNPDIVNLHLTCTLTYFLSFGCKKTKWKLVHTIHSIPKKDGSKTDRFIRKIYLKKNLLTLVGITENISKELRLMYNDEKNIYTILNGTPLYSKTIDNKPIYNLVNVARFYPVKNQIYLLEIVRELITVFPKLMVLMLGDGSELNKCKEYVKTYNLSNNVIFKGSVDNVEEYLHQSQAFILTSIYEGNPISILEAMSAGLPIISTDVGGVPEIVEDQVNGCLIKLNDAKDSANKIASFLSNESLTTFISNRNLFESKKYSIDSCGMKYLNLFKEITNVKD